MTRQETLGNPVLVEEPTLDYLEIEAIPPLPLYSLLQADKDYQPSGTETDGGASVATAVPGRNVNFFTVLLCIKLKVI